MENILIDLNEDVITILTKKLSYHAEQQSFHKRQIESIKGLISTLKENKEQKEQKTVVKTIDNPVATGNNPIDQQSRDKIKVAIWETLVRAKGKPLTIAAIFQEIEEKYFDFISKFNSVQCKQIISQYCANWNKSGRLNEFNEKIFVEVSKNEGEKNQYYVSISKLMKNDNDNTTKIAPTSDSTLLNKDEDDSISKEQESDEQNNISDEKKENDLKVGAVVEYPRSNRRFQY